MMARIRVWSRCPHATDRADEAIRYTRQVAVCSQHALRRTSFEAAFVERLECGTSFLQSEVTLSRKELITQPTIILALNEAQ